MRRGVGGWGGGGEGVRGGLSAQLGTGSARIYIYIQIVCIPMILCRRGNTNTVIFN